MAKARTLTSPSRSLIAVAFATIALSACTDTNIVYRNRPPFNPPPSAAAGFLGYYDFAVKQTTCGNCHSNFQAKWVTTKHAGAYAAVTSNANQAPECYACHTLNGNGNKATGTVAGWAGWPEAVYQDVQCESCHGPGLEHVEGVGSATLIRPLARIGMSGPGNCKDCHSGNHQPFAEEWGASGHANVSASRASNPTCWGCHDGRKVLARWGVDDNFAERDSATAYQPTTCAVCHNPHGSDNPSQLRFPITSQDPEENLCMKCHLRRAEPTLDSSSPHAPQGATLLGFAGWRPPGFTYDTSRIYGSHATTKNPKLCAGCHAGKFDVLDPTTGNLTFSATGHLMRPIPCLDGTGKPIADKTCAYNSTARSWKTCTAAGCHGDASVASNLFNGQRANMKFFADILWANLNNDGSLQASPTDGGLLATVKQTSPTQWSNTDLVITPAEGAEFNARLCGEYNQSNSDNSKGAHNPFLCEALLIATINYVRTFYGLPGLAPEVQARLEGPIGGALNRSMHVSRTPPGR